MGCHAVVGLRDTQERRQMTAECAERQYSSVTGSTTRPKNIYFYVRQWAVTDETELRHSLSTSSATSNDRLNNNSPLGDTMKWGVVLMSLSGVMTWDHLYLLQSFKQ